MKKRKKRRIKSYRNSLSKYEKEERGGIGEKRRGEKERRKRRRSKGYCNSLSNCEKEERKIKVKKERKKRKS